MLKPPTATAAAFARAIEVARASLDGIEALALTTFTEQVMPMDRLIAVVDAVEIARAELLDLERWPASGTQSSQVH